MILQAAAVATSPFFSPAVIGILVGAGVTFALQQFTAWRQRKHETMVRAEARQQAHETWVLQMRYDAFFAYLELIDAGKFRHYLKRKPDMSDEALQKMQSIARRVGFIGSDSMKDVSMNLRTVFADLLAGDATVQDFENARNAFLNLARHELRTSD